MSDSSHRLEIRCNPANPVLYLACCGLFDLLARIDPAARGHWRASAPTAFLLDTTLTEADFLKVLLDTFCALSHWRFLPENLSEPTTIAVTFTSPSQVKFTVPLDWWFETAALDGAVEEKSAWKMYAGQMTVYKITTDMISVATAHRKKGTLPTSLSELLASKEKMTGRFGFDPVSSRNALNVGFSRNDLGMPVDTFFFAELLAVFGLASFFPGRAGRANKLESCRGWLDRKRAGADGPDRGAGFRYHLWSRPMPITLARYAAFSATGGTAFFAPRDDSRGKYKNFSPARTI